MTLTVAMTGATGFVGREAALAFAAAGHRLRLLVRDAARLDRRVAGTGAVVTGGLADRSAVQALVDGADVVVHVAGAIKATGLAGFRRDNRDGTAGLVADAAAAGVGRFVHVSSLAARRPELSGYCLSKREAEQAVAGQAGGLAWTVLRPPAVYGPGDRATLPLIGQLARRHALLTGRPDQKVSLIHVRDLAAALLEAAAGGGGTGRVLDLDDGTPGGYGWTDLARAAEKTVGHRVNVHLLPHSAVWMAGLASETWGRLSGQAQILTRGKAAELYAGDWVAGPDRFERFSRWQPQTGFADGFAETLEWYRLQGWLPGAAGGTTTAPRGAQEKHEP